MRRIRSFFAGQSQQALRAGSRTIPRAEDLEIKAASFVKKLSRLSRDMAKPGWEGTPFSRFYPLLLAHGVTDLGTYVSGRTPEQISRDIRNGPGSPSLMMAWSAWGELGVDPFTDRRGTLCQRAIQDLQIRWSGEAADLAKVNFTLFKNWVEETFNAARKISSASCDVGFAYNAAFRGVVDPGLIDLNRKARDEALARGLGVEAVEIAELDRQYEDWRLHNIIKLATYYSAIINAVLDLPCELPKPPLPKGVNPVTRVKSARS